MKCLNCESELQSKYAVKFCSSNCSATYNNLRRTRSKNNKICKDCGTDIKNKSTYCKACYNDNRIKISPSYTLGNVRQLYKDKTTMAIAAKIRGYGITIYNKSDKPKYCANCGYSKHYEVCHIKPVKEFPDSAIMAEVHALDNLIALCPNCHWEFDHGMLDLDSKCKT